MPKFTNHADVLDMLTKAQDAETDMREKAREAKLFLNKTDGQWEPFWWNLNSGRPRYTFDMTTPVVDQIAGEMQQADFDIRVSPAGGDASKEVAKTNDGIIRNIENISNATHIFNSSARQMIICGIDGWRVNTSFVGDNSFDQDLVIERVPNWSDRVWLDSAAQNQDGSDAKWGVVETGILKTDYKDKWPKGSEESLDDGRSDEAYFNKPDMILVGELLYIKEIDREIVEMSNGKVHEVDDNFQAVVDDLALAQVTEVRRRTRKDKVCFSRMFDNGGFLEAEKETVFSWIPLIPTYGNFQSFENKLIYFGVVRGLTDYQRVFNYLKSREIEEGSLAPRAKYWMTPKQMAGFEDELATLNTNADPVQGFNPDQENPGVPQQNGGAVINAGIITSAQSMQDGLARSAGLFAASMGEQVNNQSGVAIKALQTKGNTGTIKYFAAQEIAICHTARILMDAIPKVYDTQRQLRILGEDGSVSMEIVNQTITDQQTGEQVTLNDLRAGKYDVTCSAGPSFQSRQEETSAAFLEMAALDPTIIQQGGDILFNNLSAPGMDLMAERKRVQLLNAGAIPSDQMTDDEKQAAQQAQEQAAQKQQEPDPLFLAAQAEMAKAQAEGAKAQAQAEKNQIQSQKDQQDAANKAAQTQIKQQESELKFQKEQAAFGIKQAEFDLKQQKQEFDQQLAFQQHRRNMATQQLNDLKLDAETLKIIREAMGVDAIVGPHNQAAYINQAQNLNEAVVESENGDEIEDENGTNGPVIDIG